MNLGKNIQYLRKQMKVTQEEFAEQMAVSRQTVVKREAGDAIPELGKLLEICDYFSCTLDEIIRKNLSEDKKAYMERWASASSLLAFDKNAKRIGWDFPFVSSEQKNRFGLRGYVAAYILPQGFETDYPGVEIAEQKEADYAVITIREPFENAFERIPNACKMIM